MNTIPGPGNQNTSFNLIKNSQSHPKNCVPSVCLSRTAEHVNYFLSAVAFFSKASEGGWRRTCDCQSSETFMWTTPPLVVRVCPRLVFPDLPDLATTTATALQGLDFSRTLANTAGTMYDIASWAENFLPWSKILNEMFFDAQEQFHHQCWGWFLPLWACQVSMRICVAL